MNYFFVDYENVNTEGFNNTKLLKEQDTVIIIYSETSKKITIDIMRDLLEKGAAIKCIKASVGSKNALDFQLSSYLGYIIGQQQKRDTRFYIVSKDTGYDKLCEFWDGQNVEVRRICNLSGDTEAKETPKKKQTKNTKSKAASAKKSMATLAEIEEYLSPEELPNEILKLVNQYKTKQSIMKGISKKFKDSKKAGDIYQKLKPLLKEKKKS